MVPFSTRGFVSTFPDARNLTPEANSSAPEGAARDGGRCVRQDPGRRPDLTHGPRCPNMSRSAAEDRDGPVAFGEEGVMGVWENLTSVLEGEVVRLEPLAWRHEEWLFRAAEEEEIWQWMQYGAARGREPFRRWIGTAIRNSEAGTEGAFATLDARTGEPIGRTRSLRPGER